MQRLFVIVLLSIFSLQITAQNRVLTGQVRRMGGGLIPGAKVSAYEAPSISTLTDAQGEYRLEVPPEVKHLQVSYTEMQTKVVSVGKFNTVNIILKPAKNQTLRFGAGLSYGTAGFTVTTNPSISYIDTSGQINLNPLSFHVNLRYKFKPALDVQAILEEDINFFRYTISDPDDPAFGTEKQAALFRTIVSLPLNYEKSLGKTGNYSFYAGLGPQINHFSYFNKWTAGLRVQTGISLNNYGFNTRFYFNYDYAGGTIKQADGQSTLPFDFNYHALKIGLLFYF